MDQTNLNSIFAVAERCYRLNRGKGSFLPLSTAFLETVSDGDILTVAGTKVLNTRTGDSQTIVPTVKVLEILAGTMVRIDTQYVIPAVGFEEFYNWFWSRSDDEIIDILDP